MTCKYCDCKLAPLRSLTDGEFCSDEHRQAFHQTSAQADLDDLGCAEQPLATAFDSGANAGPPQAVNAASIVFSARAPMPDESSEFRPTPVEPILQSAAAIEEPPPVEPWQGTPSRPAAPVHLLNLQPALSRCWHWVATAWKTAPLELRAMALLLPILIAVACALAAPSRHLSFNPRQASEFRARTRQALSTQWHFLAERIANRAAIAITDDFRSGLDSWNSRTNLTHTWSFDANGFVQPGPLAILKPTEDLRDYTFEFLGEVEQKGMGCAFRAHDLDNYYAVKFVRVDTGALPALRLIRYAVINGKEGPRVEKPLPSSIRADMLNRFRVEVHGGDFTILAQGEVVDFFSDSRLSEGGVGFFCSRGEKARLRWVEVSHQYDTLGRLCALLAPVGLAGVDKD
jgi:hypothetical protein